MSKPDLVCWYVRWDKAGRVIERLYRPRDAADTQPAPADPVAKPAKRDTHRGGVAPTQPSFPFDG